MSGNSCTHLQCHARVSGLGFRVHALTCKVTLVTKLLRTAIQESRHAHGRHEVRVRRRLERSKKQKGEDFNRDVGMSCVGERGSSLVVTVGAKTGWQARSGLDQFQVPRHVQLRRFFSFIPFDVTTARRIWRGTSWQVGLPLGHRDSRI